MLKIFVLLLFFIFAYANISLSQQLAYDFENHDVISCTIKDVANYFDINSNDIKKLCVAKNRFKKQYKGYFIVLHNQPFIYISNNLSKKLLQKVVIHEMIHYYQYLKGDLKFSVDFKILYWKNKRYNNNLSYYNREWEKEAFNLTYKIYKKLKHNTVY